MDESDRRWGSRVPFAAHVLVASATQAWEARIQDMAEGGCGIFVPPGFALLVADVVTLYFHDGPGPAQVVGARVARIEPNSVGFEYHEPQSVPPGAPVAVDLEVAPYL